MTKEERLTTVDLTAFYDDFEAFNDYCSFLCDAMSSLFSEYKDSEPDTHTIMGAKRHLHALKCQAEALKIELSRLHKATGADPTISH